MYFAQKAGYRIGDKLMYMKIWSANNKKATLPGIDAEYDSCGCNYI